MRPMQLSIRLNADRARWSWAGNGSVRPDPRDHGENGATHTLSATSYAGPRCTAGLFRPVSRAIGATIPPATAGDARLKSP
jgi:hypothetical protein